MGQTYGKLTGHSPTYTFLCLIVAAKYTARSITRNQKSSTPQSFLTILDPISNLLSSKNIISSIAGDAVGLAVAWRILCWLTSISDFIRLTNKQKYDSIGQFFFDSFKDLPPLSWHLRKEAIKMEEGLRKTLKSSPHVTPMISELPEEGRDAKSLIAEVGLICSLALTTTIEHVLTFYSLIR